MTEIPQALAQRMKNLLREYQVAHSTGEVLGHTWADRCDAVLRELQPPDPLAEAVKKVNIMVMQTGEGYSWHDVVAAWSTIKAAVARPSESWIRADEREKAEADIAEYAKVSAPLLSLDIRAGAYRARATTEATPVNDADHGPQKYAMKGPADYIAEGRKAMYAEMMEWNRRLSPGVAARIMAEGPKP